MAECTVKASATVVNSHGLHLRPADMFARAAMKFKSAILVTFQGQSVDGRSIVELLMLAARQGSELQISATGDDAEAAVATLVDMVQQGFGELDSEAAE